MKKLDKNRVPCPKCGVVLRPMKDEDRILTYISLPGCGETFDPIHLTDSKHERQLFVLGQRNPAFSAELPEVWTAASLTQLLKDVKTGEKHLAYHLVGWRGFDDVEWHVWPPDA